MDPTSREDLSALMDGELAAEPTRFLLRRLDHDPELAATWSRWHLIRAVLASDPARMSGAKADDGFAERVARAVATDVAPRHRWARFVGGGAIAAGVAVAALVLSVPRSPEVQPAVPVPAPAIAGHASGRAADTALASISAARAPGTPPWLLTRQPTVLAAQPASANVVFGTGLLQPDYLRPAAYASDPALLAFPLAQPQDPAAAPYAIQLVPERRAERAIQPRH